MISWTLSIAHSLILRFQLFAFGTARVEGRHRIDPELAVRNRRQVLSPGVSFVFSLRKILELHVCLPVVVNDRRRRHWSIKSQAGFGSGQISEFGAMEEVMPLDVLDTV